MIYEIVETINGKRKIKRIKTSLILILSFLCLISGIVLIVNEIFLGGTLVLFFFPCLLLYPLIRFFFFGGKDSIAGVVTTVVVEEVAKGVIIDTISKKKINSKN